MTFRGHVKDGVVVLDGPERLPDGMEVTVRPMSASVDQEVRRTLRERLKPVIGIAKGLPSDGSINHDHYLYGGPKRT